MHFNPQKKAASFQPSAYQKQLHKLDYKNSFLLAFYAIAKRLTG